MLRIRVLSTLLAAATLALATACEEAPDYPEEPSIEFKSLTAERVNPTDGNTPYNIITLTISYKDGDGDLGLSEDDRKSPPFNDTRPNSYNEYHFNYLVKLYWFNNATQQFELYNVPFLSYDGAFPRLLKDTDKPQPIRGDIVYQPGGTSGLTITTPQFRPGNRIKYQVQIIDRAQHKSNVLMTDELVLP